MSKHGPHNRVKTAMRKLMERGIVDEPSLVDAGAEVLGGDESAKLQAQRIFDKHFKIMGAN